MWYLDLNLQDHWYWTCLDDQTPPAGRLGSLDKFTVGRAQVVLRNTCSTAARGGNTACLAGQQLCTGQSCTPLSLPPPPREEKEVHGVTGACFQGPFEAEFLRPGLV